MTTAEGFAPAKINLTLHVTGQRADGYHLLDSLVVFADIGDRLWYEPGDALSLTVTGRFADGVPADTRNLVWKAAQACGWTGHIRLEKNLPHGAGIGGGSSDAAAVLRDLDGADHALSLGADVPVCLSCAPQRMQGIGEAVRPVPSLPPLDLVLVNPGVHVPTPQVFKALTCKENPDMGDIPSFDSRADFLRWLALHRNDLQQPAVTQAPQIADALGALQDAELFRMSGSGATCFGIYPDQAAARTKAAAIAHAHGDWWVTATQTL
jgi:4-diphosphocytidyl-2-C-methyl-D-erythritol kinase